MVTGVIQGAGYRHFTMKAAERLDLRGYVSNRYSGDVEIEVEGERGLVEEMIKILKTGPPAA
ncbi:MAG: acylphosphatase, partial [Fidelibacterota bacterium]